MTANGIKRRIIACFTALTMFTVLPVAAQNAQADALFQDLGGKDGIKKIVDDLLRIVLKDGRIKKKFDDVDMEHLAKRLAEQFCELSGGPCQYAGKDMKTIH